MHRVHLPPGQDQYTGVGLERRTKSRYSIPYFVIPNTETMMECLPVCQSPKNPPKYEPILYGELFRIKASEVLKA
jgi:isopenicillin N synthase-like dioxygenase